MMLPNRARFIHQVDVHLPTSEAVDATGSLTQSPDSTIATGVTCLVIDKGGNRMTPFGREGLEVKRARVLFPDPIDLRQGHRLAFVDGQGRDRTYVVDSFRDDQDQGRLFVAECKEFVDPISE